MMKDMRCIPLTPLLMLSLLAACGPAPSAQSVELETKLIPKIQAWSISGPPIFDLAAALRARKYEAVCVIPDYHCLDDQKGIGRIDEYHSSFGMCIPEGSHALMLIGENKAHAALIKRTTLDFDIPGPGGKCVPSAKATLRTARDTHPVVAGLQRL
jgi:hypothetical protein